MGESLGYDPVVSRLALFYLTLTFLLEMPHSNLAWKTNVKNAKPVQLSMFLVMLVT